MGYRAIVMGSSTGGMEALRIILAAISSTEVDHITALTEIGPLLKTLINVKSGDKSGKY